MTLRARFAMTRSQTPIAGPGGLLQKDWYLFFTNLYTAVTGGTPQPEEAANLTTATSPYTYQAVIRGQAHIDGGTVSLIEFSRNGTNWYDTGITEGFVQMDERDQLRVTYSSVPNITFFAM